MNNEMPKAISRDDYIEATGISGNQLVDDKNKAHVEAIAGDEGRTSAAMARKLGEIMIGVATFAQDNDRMEAAITRMDESVQLGTDRAETAEVEAGQAYERDQANDK